MKGHFLFQGEIRTEHWKHLNIQTFFFKNLWANCKQNLAQSNFFSRTTQPISIRLGKKYPWVKEIHENHENVFVCE